METRDNFLVCPVCGRKTATKVIPGTVLKTFPLFCKNCKNQSIIDYEAKQHTVSQRQRQL